MKKLFLYLPTIRIVSRSMSNSVKVAVVQLNCTADKEKNLGICEKYIKEAAQKSAKMVFLPEDADFIGENRQQTLALSEPLSGTSITRFCKLAKSNGVFLNIGGFHRLGTEGLTDRIYNSNVIIDDKGDIRSVYDKLHLFDVEITGGLTIRESDMVLPGANLVDPVQTPVGKVGQAICYDMRFPDMAQFLRERGADVLIYPSAFTVKTGEAHWHLLLRTRAVETQCFVIAAAQAGSHNAKRASYGHSLVVDPWGRILAERDEDSAGLLLCDLPLQLVVSCRREMPVYQHRRWDLFPSCGLQGVTVEIGSQTFQFGPKTIDPSCVFYRSRLTFGFVNLSPLVPGHVLVSPLRNVERFEELTATEVTDIYAVVRRVAPFLMRFFGANSLTISQQDGKDAGQSIPHVHIHVLPRKPGDFEVNDDIYQKLQKHDKDENKERKFRTLDQMSKEAVELRKLFY